MVKLPCSRRGNHATYIASVTPYKTKALGIWKNLVKTISTEILTKLLRQEDLEGLRAIEMALHLGCILLFDEHTWHLTGTENTGWLEKKMQTNEKHVHIFKHGMLPKWARAKLIINIVPIFIRFALRFFAFLAFYLAIRVIYHSISVG